MFWLDPARLLFSTSAVTHFPPDQSNNHPTVSSCLPHPKRATLPYVLRLTIPNQKTKKLVGRGSDQGGDCLSQNALPITWLMWFLCWVHCNFTFVSSFPRFRVNNLNRRSFLVPLILSVGGPLRVDRRNRARLKSCFPPIRSLLLGLVSRPPCSAFPEPMRTETDAPSETTI